MAGEPTFAPTVNPSLPVEVEYVPRLLKAAFGDGYGVATPDGLNHVMAKISLTWENVSGLEAKNVMDFMQARGGYQAFMYQPPHSDFTTAVKWTAPVYRSRRVEVDTYVVNVDLEQDFRL